MRRYLIELGRRLAVSGTLRETEDVFWLTDEELRAEVKALDAGRGTKPMADQVEARHGLAQVEAGLRPPYSLPEGRKPAFWWRWAFPVPELNEQRDTDRLHGMGVNSGRVTAVARVLRGIEEAERLSPGEILVTRTTTPAWTPLFTKAAGLVTDLGGPLSHGSIVAREYGIPAVMGTGSATQRIADGQTITVDGQRGEVLLQARLINARSQGDTALPAAWPLPSKGPFSRSSIVDFLPDPVSPLFATLGRDRFNAGHERLMEWFIGDKHARMTWLDIINGYAYVSASLSFRAWLRILLAVPRVPHLVRTVESRWRDEAVPRYREAVSRWQARDLLELSAGDLLVGAREIYDVAVDHLATLQSGLLGWAGGAEGLYQVVYDRLIRRPGDPDSMVLVRGYDNVPIQAEKTLYDLAQWISGQAEVVAYLRRCSTGQLAAELSGSDAPEGIHAATWGEFQSRWQAYLERYGAMIYNFDFGQPLPMDEPSPLLETLKLFVSGAIPDPYHRQQRLTELREAAVQSILKSLKGVKRRLFVKVLSGVNKFAPLREDSIAFIGYGYPQLRRMLKEIGRRMVQAGAIDLPENIFWLDECEVEGAAAALDRNVPLAPRLSAIHQRQAEWQARKRLNPSPILPPTKKFFIGRMNMGGFWSGNSSDQAAELLKGTAASPGRVTAPACVMHGPEDFSQMQPGRILVAEITTPAWTPLFAMAAAVVTDVGGPLSHGSILAREYGIPAVMGTGEATRRIQNGQTITVDGSAGTVTC
jgi:pyruvate,water dikinase